MKDLTIHLNKNLNFLLDKKNFFTANDDNEFSKLDPNTFQSNLVEKSSLSLITLLRKNSNDESLNVEIIKTFISLSKSKKDLSNLFVKSGCIRLIYNILDNISFIKTVILSLTLIKQIIISSQENLEMISKQSKFYINQTLLRSSMKSL